MSIFNVLLATWIISRIFRRVSSGTPARIFPSNRLHRHSTDVRYELRRCSKTSKASRLKLVAQFDFPDGGQEENACAFCLGCGTDLTIGTATKTQRPARQLRVPTSHRFCPRHPRHYIASSRTIEHPRLVDETWNVCRALSDQTSSVSIGIACRRKWASPFRDVLCLLLASESLWLVIIIAVIFPASTRVSESNACP